MVPTYPSVVLYARVKAGVFPPDTAPIEMLIGNTDELDESEVTVYMLSIDDKSLCPPGEHTVVAIGPTFEAWDGDIDYAAKKEAEHVRLTAVLERRFPGFSDAVVYAEVATPRTIERYTNKNGGTVAGPKMMLGQHMFRRQHTRTQWDTLYCCGESTVMGTGTPTVTTTGISAANAILKKRRLLPYVYRPGMKNHVRMLPIPFTKEQLFGGYPQADQSVMKKAFRCEFCEHPACTNGSGLDVQGVMRRTTVGNFFGAKRLMERTSQGVELTDAMFIQCESRCVLNKPGSEPVAIREVFEALGKIQ
jgi:prolycopene isomerase